MTGLSTVLGLLIAAVIVTIIVVLVFLMRRNIFLRNIPRATESPHGMPPHGMQYYIHFSSLFKMSTHIILCQYTHTHTCTHTLTVVTHSEQPSSTTTAAQLYENTELPPPASAAQENNNYEQIELNPTTDYEKAIKLTQNSAYGKVQR